MTGLSCPNLYHIFLKSHSEMCVIEIPLQMKGSESNFYQQNNWISFIFKENWEFMAICVTEIVASQLYANEKQHVVFIYITLMHLADPYIQTYCACIVYISIQVCPFLGNP